MKYCYTICYFLMSCCWVYPTSPYNLKMLGTQPDQADIAQYEYDNSGNRIRGGSESRIDFGLVGKPVAIKQGAKRELFRYSLGGGQHYLRGHADGRKTFYLDGGEVEFRLPESPEEEANYAIFINDGNYSPKVQVNLSDTSSPNYSYSIQDHLGSSVVTANDDGIVEGRERFSPCGQLVAAAGNAKPLGPDDEFGKGFTGHETLAPFDLVHMNGRVYDPLVCQFLSPDRHISPRMGLPHVNPYAYLANSPLNGTDPSGWVIHWYAATEELQPRIDFLHKKVMEMVASSDEFTRLYAKLATDRNIYLKVEVLEDDRATHFSRDAGKTPRPEGEPWASSLNPEVYHATLDVNLNEVVRTGTGHPIEPQILFANQLRRAEQSFYMREATLPYEVFDMARPAISDLNGARGNLDGNNELVPRNTTVGELLALAERKSLPTSMAGHKAKALTAHELLQNDAVHFEGRVAVQSGMSAEKFRQSIADTQGFREPKVRARWLRPFPE